MKWLTELFESFRLLIAQNIGDILLFFIMGVLSIVKTLSDTDEKIDLKKKVGLFYANTVAGWGLFSLITGWNSWFGEWPQKVFTVMTVVYVGINVLESIRSSNWVTRLVKHITNFKG